jgi:pyrimidine-specific ribonucleoside hydrolase
MQKLILAVALCCAGQFAEATTVWIDTDVSIGSPIREVDDAYALVLAFHSPEIRIAGLSTSYGNAPLGHTTRAARDLVARFGRPDGMTVIPGARAASEIGSQTAASDALATALQNQRLTYIALGPLTNLASFLQLHPKLAHRIDRVILVGGQLPGTDLGFGPKRSFRIHDANVFKDPAAAAAVMRSKIPLTIVPIPVAARLIIDAANLGDLEKNGGAGSYLARRSRTWLWFWTKFVRLEGGPIFDALAVLPTTNPGVLTIEDRYAKMDDEGNLRVVPRSENGARRVRVCTEFARETKLYVLRRLRQTPDSPRHD